MQRFTRWICLSACYMGIAFGAETYAFHFCGLPYTGYETDGAVVTDRPVTPFITAGDELLDLTRDYRLKRIPLKDGWVIWNRTRRLLVVHGNVMDGWRVERASGFQNQPLQVRLAVDWLRSGEAGGEDVRFASVSSISRSTSKSDASAQFPDADGTWTFNVAVEPVILENRDLICGFKIEWKGPEGATAGEGKLSTTVLLVDGGSQTLGSWHADGCGPESRFTVRPEILLTDGTLLRNARLRQTGDQSVILDSSVPAGVSVAGFTDFPNPIPRKIKAMKFPRQDILSWNDGPDEPLKDDDPFAEPADLKMATPLKNLPEAAIPENLTVVFKNLLDLRELFAKAAISLKGDDFAFYDPNREVLFVACDSGETWKFIEQLFLGHGHVHVARNVESAAWLAESASPDKPVVKMTLHAQSGVKAGMDWTDPKKRPIASFHPETVLGGSGDILDLTYEFVARLPGKSPDSQWKSESNVTLSNGVRLLSDAVKRPDGSALQQGLRATASP